MSMTVERKVDELVDAALASVVALRHDLHEHPQLAYEETYAADRAQRWLSALNIPYQAGVGETGVVAWIEPTDPAARRRSAVALRADMDALPITEATGLPYASKHPGCMHACGHDGHTAILLGVASVLAELRDALPRPVKLLFQPAEEGGAGAMALIEAGALTERIGGAAVGHVFGLHGWPGNALGTVITRPGALMASQDRFTITLHGQGGHGAYPHLTTDPVVAAAHIITALQTIVARRINPTTPAVVTVGQIQAGSTANVIPDRAEMWGTTRALDAHTRQELCDRLTALAQQTAAAMGCRAEVEIHIGYPPVVNDSRAAEHVLQTAGMVVGEENVVIADRPTMGAEDFAFYGQAVPSAFLFLGLCPPGVEHYAGLHTPTFDFNDAAIPTGIRMMSRIALSADNL